MNCLSHELDLAYWLFGMPEKLIAFGGQLSFLEMDVEDTADIQMQMKRGHQRFPVNVHLDFLQKPARRYTHLIGEFGTANFDYVNRNLQLNFNDDRASEHYDYGDYARNQMFKDELDEFLACVKTKRQPSIPLEDGISVLRLCEAARRSLMTGSLEVLE